MGRPQADSNWRVFRRLPALMQAGAWLAASAPVVALVAYAVQFRTHELSSTPESWGQFGDYLGGSIGWLIGVITLCAVYATYTKEREAHSDQERHATATIELLRDQNKKLEEQLRQAGQHAFETHVATLVQLLIDSIQACHHNSGRDGGISGHTYFSLFAEETVRCYTASLGTPRRLDWTAARASVLGGRDSEWNSIRSQIELLARLIDSTTRLDSADRSYMMAILASHVSSGVALFLAIDCQSSENKHLAELLNKYGLARSAPSHLHSDLLNNGLLRPTAFGLKVEEALEERLPPERDRNSIPITGARVTAGLSES